MSNQPTGTKAPIRLIGVDYGPLPDAYIPHHKCHACADDGAEIDFFARLKAHAASLESKPLLGPSK